MMQASAEFVRAVHQPDGFLRDGRQEAAFAGRSNVGKSSLLNCLLGRRDLARTSSTPGRTQSINYFLVNDTMYFVDLPGYGYAKASHRERERWAGLIGAYLDQAVGRLLPILLVDAKVGATDSDLEAASYLRSFSPDLEVVATKVDKLKQSQRHRALAKVRERLNLERAPIAFSSKTKEGVKELWRAILARS